MNATTPINKDIQSKLPSNPVGHNTWYAKNTARFIITPTTAAVIPNNGAVKCQSPRVASMAGPPIKINKNEGRKVKNVTTQAATMPASGNISGPNNSFVQPPTNSAKVCCHQLLQDHKMHIPHLHVA